MKRHAGCVLLVAATALAGLCGAAESAPRLRISRIGFRFLQIERVPGHARSYDVAARASVVNLGDAATDVTASLTSGAPGFLVLDGTVSFGNVPRTSPFGPARLQRWRRGTRHRHHSEQLVGYRLRFTRTRALTIAYGSRFRLDYRSSARGSRRARAPIGQRARIESLATDRVSSSITKNERAP